MENRRSLVERVMPTFLNTSGPVGEEEVAGFERRHNLRLPAAYRTFLLEINGGAPKPSCVAGTDLQYLYSLHASRDFIDLDYAQGSFADLPASHIAIGTDPSGKPFLLDCGAGAVLLFDHRRGKEDRLTLVAPDFGSFLALLRADAGCAAT
ncbi:MAG TPA: SMI1/KNR4 family protein [Polyangiaceae bacterium]